MLLPPIILPNVAAGRRRFGVRCLGIAFGRRLVAVKPPVRFASREPLNAALLGRQAGQAAKAVTSDRTPKTGPAASTQSPGGLTFAPLVRLSAATGFGETLYPCASVVELPFFG